MGIWSKRKMTQLNLKGNKRIPDIIPTPEKIGHLRHNCYNDAILSCGQNRLPEVF